MKDSTEGVADGQVTASAGLKESATVVSMEHPKQKADGTYMDKEPLKPREESE